MLKALVIYCLLSGSLFAASNKITCPQIDMKKMYSDGIAYCPKSVKDNAFSVTNCAYRQAKVWHAATDVEKKQMNDLIDGFKNGNAPKILENTESLKLQVCRSQKDKDSFLLAYTKPDVRAYSGPFLMYREGGLDSGIVIHSPHDGQDGTHASTKDAFQNSNALALISNGHPRTLSGGAKGPYASDWSHTKADLGYTAFLAFRDKFPQSVHLHIHGCAGNKVLVTDSVAWDGAKHLLRTAFIDAMNKSLGARVTPITVWRFDGWASGVDMTRGPGGVGRAANERWVGAEIAVRLHQNTKFLTKTVITLEADYLKKSRDAVVDFSDVLTDLSDTFIDSSHEILQ